MERQLLLKTTLPSSSLLPVVFINMEIDELQLMHQSKFQAARSAKNQ